MNPAPMKGCALKKKYEEQDEKPWDEVENARAECAHCARETGRHAFNLLIRTNYCCTRSTCLCRRKNKIFIFSFFVVSNTASGLVKQATHSHCL